MIVFSRFRKSKLILLLIILSLIVIGGVALASKQYSFFSPKNKDQKTREEIDDLIAKVGKHALLPVNELPTIATISDTNKLPQQSFYKRAEKGDKLLLYTRARVAYLYRPKTDKIIEITPLMFESELNRDQPASTGATEYQ